jgi:hypothetical protein
MSPASLIAPFATLAVLGIAGLGIAGLIAPRAPRDAQVALAPLVAAAIVFVTSPILLLDVPPRTLTAATLGVLVLATVVRRRHSIAIARRAAIPASLACLALVLFAAPALRHGTWAAATTGNQDAYVWVSQARSLEHGPPNGPAATTPDRVPYDLLSRQSWPVAIPGSLAELSAATWVDPVHAYGMFSAVIGAMLALAVFVGARGCLYWSQRRSAAAALVMSLNGLALFSSFYGWQAQLLVTTAATLFVLLLPGCFEEESGVHECAGPAVFGASAIALYGWTVAPFVLVAVAVCWEVRRRRTSRTTAHPSFTRRLVTITALTVALGSVAMTRAAVTLVHGAQHNSARTLSYWSQYAWSFPSDALGLVPRSPQDVVPGAAWEVVAVAVSAILIVQTLRAAYSSSDPGSAVVATACLTILVELIGLALVGSNPYPSLKLMGYSAPLWTLLVLGRPTLPARDTRPVSQLSAAFVKVLKGCFLSVTACLFVTTTAFALSRGLRETVPGTEVLPAARAASALLPRDRVTLLGVESAWDQVWLAYFLRDRPVATLQPSIVFTGYSVRDAARPRRFDTQASFEIRENSPGPSIWSDGKFAIYAINRHPGK